MEITDITIDTIIGVFKNKSEAKPLKDIKAAVVQLVCPKPTSPENKTAVEDRVGHVIKMDLKQGKSSFLSYSNRKYRQRRNTPPPGNPVTAIDTRYEGTAGELAVMSELVFRGYNVNRMLIDDGIDIVAMKDNTYYYIQVKTTKVKSGGNITCAIPERRFNQFINSQIRYIIVARQSKGGVDSNLYFTFTPAQIEQGLYQHYISKSDNKINIKIKFNPRSGEPVLYDMRESGDMGFCMNNFL